MADGISSSELREIPVHEKTSPIQEPAPEAAVATVIHPVKPIDTSEDLADVREELQEIGTAQDTATKDKKGLLRKAVDKWSEPKGFESEKLYRGLGVHLYSKYLPWPTGDIVRRRLMKMFPDSKFIQDSSLIKGSNLESLKKAHNESKELEAIHVGFFGAISALTIPLAELGGTTGAVLGAAVNTAVNVYPIMLQRYKRLRLNRVINMLEQREAKNKAQPDRNEPPKPHPVAA